jgi:hypothetical protein
LLSIPAKDIANSSVIASTLSTQNEELRNAWTMSRSVRGDCYCTSRKINPWHHGLNPHQKRTISVAILHFKELNSYSHFFVPLPLQDVKPPLPAVFCAPLVFDSPLSVSSPKGCAKDTSRLRVKFTTVGATSYLAAGAMPCHHGMGMEVGFG